MATRNFLLLLKLSAVSVAITPPLDVSCQNVAAGHGADALYGASNNGFVDILHRGQLTQRGSIATADCASITGGIQSSLYVNPGAALIQDAKAILQLGNYSRVVFDSGCQVNMGPQSEIVPDQAFGAGRIELYCSAEMTLGTSSYISMGQQSFINVTATFTVGENVIIDMQPSSTMIIGNELAMADAVWLTLKYNSRLVLNPTSGSIAQITSSKTGLTQLTLEPASTLVIDGDFLVGAGTLATMTLDKSGFLEITPSGQFQVEAANFFVGPSSFWIISGNFLLDGTSTFDSGVQSNLTVSGNMETRSGSLSLAGFSSMIVQGSCTNQGSLQTQKFAQLIMWPGSNVQLSSSTIAGGEWSTVNINGAVTLKASSNIQLGSGADFQQFGTLTMLGSTFTVGEGASLQLLSSASDELNIENMQLTLERGAELVISKAMTLKGGARIHLGPGARMEIRNTFSMNGGSISLSQGAYFAINQQFQFEGGSISLGRGATAYFNGTAATTTAYNLSLDTQASVVLESGAKFTPGAGASTKVGAQTDVFIRQGAAITVGKNVQINVGAKSILTFDPAPYPSMTCFINSNTNLITFTNTTFSKRAQLPTGDFCF